MKDMRDFVAEAEAKGLCKRIKAEVDWDLELSHIAKLNEEASGPALLFENVKGYDTPVITSVCTTTERLALIMGQPLGSTLVNLYDAWAKLGENLLPPKYVDKAVAPCKENILTGDQIDLYKFPVPKWYPSGRRTLYRHGPLFHFQRPGYRMGQSGHLPRPTSG